jgi:hypothetical protein
MEATIDFAPAIPFPRSFDVQKRIQELRGYLDPNNSDYQPEQQHTNTVIQVTKARLVNTLTSTSLTSRSGVISALGRYNQKCDVVENECL